MSQCCQRTIVICNLPTFPLFSYWAPDRRERRVGFSSVPSDRLLDRNVSCRLSEPALPASRLSEKPRKIIKFP